MVDRKILEDLYGQELSCVEGHAEAFGALSHLARLSVFLLLVQEPDPVSAGDIARTLDIPAPTLSHHLAVLHRSGLLIRRREERFMVYTVDRRTVTELVRLLTACC